MSSQHSDYWSEILTVTSLHSQIHPRFAFPHLQALPTLPDTY